MAYNSKLADSIREELALAGVEDDVVERRIFGGLMFVVHSKMCVALGDE